MTSSIINYIVEKYLANILEINAENTKSNLFSGTVEMGNLKIKPQIFEQLNLPYFELVDGYVGSLKVKMSLPRFYKYPIKIFVDKVFFHARQKSMDKLNEKEEINAMENYKKNKLQSMEEISSQVSELSAEEPGMIQQIINNLQIEVGEIVLRFDDSISYPMNPFVFGLILKKVLIKTTTDKYEETGSGDNIPFAEINHKLIKVQGLSMFLDYSGSSRPIDLQSRIVEEEREKVSKDERKYLEKSFDFYTYCTSELNQHSRDIDSHHYLLYDFTTTIQIALNENIKGNNLPKVASSIIIDHILLNLEIKQISVILKLLAYFNLNNLYRAGIYKRYYKRELSYEDKLKYMDKYMDYYKFKYVKKYLNQKEADNAKSELNFLESGLTYDKVQSMRQAAMIKIDYLFNMESIESKIAEIKGKSRIFSYFSRGSDEQQIQNLLGEKEKLRGEEGKYDKMIREQLALEKGIELDMYNGLPSDYILFNFTLRLNKCVMTIGELDCRKLIDMVFDDFEVKVLLGLNFQNIFLYLNDFSVNQYKFKNPYFNKIIESYQDETGIKDVNIRHGGVSNNIAEITRAYATRKGALYIEFENNPANELSNFRFKLRNEKRLYIFANIYVLQYTMHKVVEALKSNIDMSEISQYAKGEVSKYIEEGYVDKIFSGEYTHFNIEVDLLLKGPMIIIPQNVHDTENTNCMLLSFGECQISSALPPRMDPLMDYTRMTQIDKLYDIYTIVTQGFQLSTMGDFTSIKSIYTSKTKLDIVENVNIEIRIGNLIEPKNEFFENFRLGIKVHSIQMFLRDIQIEYLIYFLDGLTQINKLLNNELNARKSKGDLGMEKMCRGVLEESLSKVVDSEERNLLFGKGGEEISKEKDSDINKESDRIEKVKAGIHKIKDDSKSNIEMSNLNVQKRVASFASSRNRKDKIFFSMEFLLNRIEMSIMKSFSPEETSIFANKPLSSPFKTYLNFVINHFNFTTSVSDKKDTKVNLKIFNMFFFDSDFIYKLDNKNPDTPQQELLIHPEFQCLMGSINDESEMVNEHHISRSASMYSEARDDPEIIMKTKGRKIQSFIEFNYNYIAAKNKSLIKVNFTKLLICPNLSSFARLFTFGKFYADLFSRVSSSHKKDVIRSLTTKVDLGKELEELKEKKEEKKAVAGGKGINKKFFKKVLTKMETRKAGINTSREIGGVHGGIVKASGLVDESEYDEPKHNIAYYRRGSMLTVKEENTHTKREKSKLKFSFEMKEIELNFPLNPNTENTKVLKFNFNMMVKLAMKSEYDNVYTCVEDKLIKQNYIMKNMNMNLMIFNVDFDIINFKNGVFLRNPSANKILSNSRLTCGLKSFLILEKETSVMNVELHIEPIIMVIGFRQVKVLRDYANAFMDFGNDIKKSFVPEEDLKGVAQKPGIDMNAYKSKIVQKIQEINDKIEDQVKYNISNFNNLMDINFKLDKAIIQMIDNTKYYNVPLTKIECSKISFKFITNSDPSDSDNMAQALVEMISRKEVTQYNIYNMYMYLDACYNTEILFYNEKVSDWEPIMEPWNAVIKLSQVNKVTRLKIDFTSDVFLNLNLSFSSVQVFNAILKKLGEDEKDWIPEDKNFLAVNKSESAKRRVSPADNEISLEFINSTGLDITFWFDAESSQKFLLPPIQKKYFSKNEMSLIYKRLDSEISLMKKDKFSLTILNSLPVEGLDFSYNHFSNLRIPFHGSHSNALNFFEVSVKIRNSGLIKSISIESNVRIHNNTKYNIGLHLIKSKEMIDNVNGVVEENTMESKEVVNVDQAGVDALEPFSDTRIPLSWLIDSYMMLGRIIDDRDEMKAYKLFYEEVNFLYSLGDQYRLHHNVDHTEEEKDNINQRFADKYSKIISFDYDNQQQINLSLDIILLKSSSDEAILTPGTKTAATHTVMNTYYYILVINPPLVLENQIPYNLGFSYGKTNEIEGINQADNTNSSTLLPLQKFPIFYVNYLDNRSDLKISFDYIKNLTFESEHFSFLDNIDKNEKVIKLFNKNSRLDSDSYDVTIRYSESDHLNIYNPNYFKLERNFSQSKKMTFYVGFLIVNKLDLRFFIKGVNSSQADEEVMRLTNNTVYEHKVNLFNLKQDKAKIKSELSDWSNAMQITTHGVDGVVSLETSFNPDDKEPDEISVMTKNSNTKLKKTTNSNANTYITDVGVIISASSHFNFSTIIILEPRYILVNQLGIDLKFRQMHTHSLPCHDISDILMSEMKVLTFRKNTEKSKKLHKYCQFSMPSSVDQEYLSLDDNWSPTVNFDSIDEFNIKLPIPKSEVGRVKQLLPKYVFSYDESRYYILVRVSIQSNDNVLIYIVLSPPKCPQFMIRNTTSEVLLLKQEEAQVRGLASNIIKIPPYTEVPFTWDDVLKEKKKVILGIKQKEIKFSFDKIEKLKEVKLFDNQLKFLYCSILMENKNKTRVLKVQMEDKEQDAKAIKQMFVNKKMSRIIKVNLSLKGFGLSIIDETPREIFYISTYCIDLRYINNIFKSEHSITNTENIELYLKNFQIDYCLEDSFKNFIYPKNQIIPANEKEKEGDIVPFLQLLVTRKNIHNIETDNKTTKISQIDFSMQELNVKVDQAVLNTLLGLVNSLLSVVDFYKAGANKSRLSGLNDERKEIVDTNLEVYVPGDYCPTLIAELEPFEKVGSQNDESNMIFIEALMISGMKINLTLRIDITSLEISLIPGFIVKVLGTLGNAIARITDSPLRFSELILQNCFTDVNKLIQLLQKHYVKQGVIQFYKILGSSDLIGNPIGLVDRLGTGFIEFFNEPRKGFLQGPKQFGEGVAKGLNSLVSNVIGGGFDTVGKITGTLLAATKNLQGEKLHLNEEDEPDNVVSGAYEGVKGGISEIGKGLAGIFMNPYRSAKQEGVKGFIKGVGTGLLGAIISPFSAVLKVGNSLAVGIRNTATYFNRGKLRTDRFRHPRHIIINEPLKPYDEDYAEVQAIIRTVGDLSHNKLILFADFKYLEDDYDKDTSTLILTDKKLVVIFNAKTKVFEVDMRMIRNTEVHIYNNNFLLVFYLIDGSKTYIITEDLAILSQVHGTLQKLIQG